MTVLYGQQKVEYGLTPTFDADTGFGTPGDYRAFFFPTAPGNYTFQFTGTIGSQKVDESFTSGPTTFSTVEDPASAQFPVKAPSNAQLAQRLEAQSGRVATSSDVSGAKTVGYIGHRDRRRRGRARGVRAASSPRLSARRVLPAPRAAPQTDAAVPPLSSITTAPSRP